MTNHTGSGSGDPDCEYGCSCGQNSLPNISVILLTESQKYLLKGLYPIRKWGVSNYFFWEEFGVVAPETCPERKRFEGG
jgi:hypothetical protein